MWRYEVLYRENGVLKNKGFGYRDQFDRFLKKLVKKGQSGKSEIEIVEIADNENGIRF